jgi:hypothetical protein
MLPLLSLAGVPMTMIHCIEDSGFSQAEVELELEK